MSAILPMLPAWGVVVAFFVLMKLAPRVGSFVLGIGEMVLAGAAGYFAWQWLTAEACTKCGAGGLAALVVAPLALLAGVMFCYGALRDDWNEPDA